tara:strand:+ start:509 stop:757 length:249 start_codon:yes stop_codon:yes gene_type:complete
LSSYAASGSYEALLLVVAAPGIMLPSPVDCDGGGDNGDGDGNGGDGDGGDGDGGDGDGDGDDDILSRDLFVGAVAQLRAQFP